VSVVWDVKTSVAAESDAVDDANMEVATGVAADVASSESQVKKLVQLVQSPRAQHTPDIAGVQKPTTVALMLLASRATDASSSNSTEQERYDVDSDDM
jgi:hypothetical protein